MVTIKQLGIEVEKLDTTCEDHKRLLQISDEKDNALREEINGMEIWLEEEKKIEGDIKNQYREKAEESDRLEAKLVSLRSHLEKKTI